MAGKKDFSTMNTAPVYNAIAAATQEADEQQQAQEVRKPTKTYSAQEAHEMMLAGTTQGRKGCKSARINMSFEPDIHEYIRIMARVRGQTVTQFTNAVFRKSMEDNKEIYEQAKAFRESL